MMLRALRRRIKALAALLTGAVVLAVCLAAFLIARREYTAGREGEFARAAAATAASWREGTLDFAQLAAAEANGGLLLYMETGGVPLGWAVVHPERAGLFEAALAAGGAENGVMELAYEGQPYRYTWQTHSRAGATHLLCVVQPIAAERAYLARLAGGFALLALAGELLVALLCWLVAGRAIRPAAAAEKAQREFIAAAGHELRTPLTVITTGLERLETKPEPSVLRLMQGETQRMERLVEDLLLLADKSSARWRIEKTRQDPVTILLDAAEAMELPARERGLRVEALPPAEGLPALLADGARIRQVLAALVDNALRFAPADSAVVLSLTAEIGGLVYAVADSGPGVPDAEKKQVFQKFYHTGAAGGHYGLGLAVAWEIARLHGGRLEVADTPGGGATFRLWLPAG